MQMIKIEDCKITVLSKIVNKIVHLKNDSTCVPCHVWSLRECISNKPVYKYTTIDQSVSFLRGGQNCHVFV